MCTLRQIPILRRRTPRRFLRFLRFIRFPTENERSSTMSYNILRVIDTLHTFHILSDKPQWSCLSRFLTHSDVPSDLRDVVVDYSQLLIRTLRSSGSRCRSLWTPRRTWGICTRRAGKLYKARSRLAGWLVDRTIFKNSFSAVSKPNFESKYSLESPRRDLHNALLCTVLESISKLDFFSLKIAEFLLIFNSTKIS